MNTHVITKDQLDSENYYNGTENLSDYSGNIEISADLGWVKFRESISAKGYIWAKAGSGIKAGLGIEAGGAIDADLGIKAGSGIKAGLGIEASGGIEAGDGIKAGWGIEAGSGIKAGEGIVAGFSIRCALALSVTLRIFAGVCWWREIADNEKEIQCGKLESGEVAHGTLIERGVPEENQSSESNTVESLAARVAAIEAKLNA